METFSRYKDAKRFLNENRLRALESAVEKKEWNDVAEPLRQLRNDGLYMSRHADLNERKENEFSLKALCCE